MKSFRVALFLSIIFVVLGATACVQEGISFQSSREGQKPTSTHQEIQLTATVPTIPAQPDQTPTVENQETEMRPDKAIWISPSLPRDYRMAMNLSTGYVISSERNEADLWLEFRSSSMPDQSDDCPVKLVYALVSPFPTVVDGISFTQLIQAWAGNTTGLFNGKPLLMGEDTFDLLREAFGNPTEGRVEIIPDDEILTFAWQDYPWWAIVPFDQLEPRWKVIAIDGVSPLDPDAALGDYPLAFQFCLASSTGDTLTDHADLRETLQATNRAADRMTSLVLTGTTALVRNVAYKMETEGILYPAREIGDLLRKADILHISNEASFFDDCPPAVPLNRESRFCSNPRYMDLFRHIGVDVIELTGNHLLDWGPEPLVATIEIYENENIPYYGGGKNLEEAQTHLLMEHHGNRFAFLGCSPAGPENVWAADDRPGSAPCDFEKIYQVIESLKDEGYLPIFTFQHFEVDDYKPHSSQRVDFNKVSQAGAIIVSGSQAHFPQGMIFNDGRFVHYGLGNLFFDQMNDLNRDAFIDWHVFYDGRHISTILLTTRLEDYSQPRPMNPAERERLLLKVFNASGW